MRLVAVLVAAMIGVFIIGAVFGSAVATDRFLCPEDGIGVGVGDYRGSVGWDSYACIARDDIAAYASRHGW